MEKQCENQMSPNNEDILRVCLNLTGSYPRALISHVFIKIMDCMQVASYEDFE